MKLVGRGNGVFLHKEPMLGVLEREWRERKVFSTLQSGREKSYEFFQKVGRIKGGEE